MKTLHYYCFICIIIISSCNSGAKLNILLDTPNVKSQDIYTIYKTEIFNTKVFDTTENFYIYKFAYKDSLLYGVNTVESNIFDVYNIQSKSKFSRIKLNRKEINDEDISALFVLSPDSIFFITSNTFNLYLINSFGDIIKKWELLKKPVSANINKELAKIGFTLPTIWPFFHMCIKDNYLHVPISFVGLYKGNEFYQQIDRIARYNLNNSKWDLFYAPLRGIMKEKGNLLYPYDLNFPYLLIRNNISYVSYPLDHYVYKYDNLTGEFIEAIPAFSKSMGKLPKPFNRKDLNNNQKKINVRIQIAFYGALLYHEKIDMYTRIAYHNQPLIDKNGNMNLGIERTSSIVILDKNLNIVGEKLFLNGALGINSYVTLPDGILFGREIETDNELLRSRNKYLIKKIK